ncbi:MAG TPA: YkgJ family cysteine cluster protein [Thermoanaerobaculia bacterium]|nr:YkgJ family cysteine cluster protein [Thermoanaerobaculia bacterium]
MKTHLSRADALWSEGAARAKKGEIACRAGCFGCCIGLFEISFAEALLVNEGLEGLPPDERREVERRARRIVTETAGDFPGDPAAGVLDVERSESDDARYFDLVADRACPMLELPSGRCRIYAERPVTCRTYGLAWRKAGAIAHPACRLNFVDAGSESKRVTAIDLDLLTAGDQEMAEFAFAAGLPAGASTTIAHAVVGEAFRSAR